MYETETAKHLSVLTDYFTNARAHVYEQITQIARQETGTSTHLSLSINLPAHLYF